MSRNASVPGLGSWPARRARITPHRPAFVEHGRAALLPEKA